MTGPVAHPAWCHRVECTVTGQPGIGAHFGRTRLVPAGELLITVRLYQGAALPRYPDSEVVLVMVEVASPTDPDFALTWPMRLGPARELAAVLRSMVAAATR